MDVVPSYVNVQGGEGPGTRPPRRPYPSPSSAWPSTISDQETPNPKELQVVHLKTPPAAPVGILPTD